MCYVHNEKRKEQIMEEIDLPNQERVRTLGEKENYKYLGIFVADTIKQVKMASENKRNRIERYVLKPC